MFSSCDDPARLAEALEPWHTPLATHSPHKIVLDLAVSLALGGDCLADIALLRSEPGIYGPVASDPTVSRMISRLAGDPDVLAAIHRARATARAKVWAGPEPTPRTIRSARSSR